MDLIIIGQNGKEFPVSGDVIGPFLIHRAIGSNYFWTATHIPSHRALWTSVVTKKACVAYVNAVLRATVGLSWEWTDPECAEAREILEKIKTLKRG